MVVDVNTPDTLKQEEETNEVTHQQQGSMVMKLFGIKSLSARASPRAKQIKESQDSDPKLQQELLKAVQDGDVDTVEQLLARIGLKVFKDIMQTSTQLNAASKVQFKTTILHVAARVGNPASFDKLMNKLKDLSPNEMNAVMDAQDSGGKSPLHVAIEEGYEIAPKSGHEGCHVHVASRLIQDGARIDIKDLMGQTPLHVAVIRNNEYITLSLLEPGERHNPIETVGSGSSTSDSSLEVVHRLLQIQDNTGKTALHHACMTGRPQLVLLILAATAHAREGFLKNLLNMTDNKNRSPLFYAAQKGHSLIVWLLAQELRVFGTTLSTLVDEDEKTLLHWAADGEHGSTVDALLAAVAVELKDSASKSKTTSKTIQPATIPNPPPVAFYINKKSKEGLRALDLAVNKVNPKDAKFYTIRSLLEHGATPASQGHDQLTSLQRACFSNNKDVIIEMQNAAETLVDATKSEKKLEEMVCAFIRQHKETINALKDKASQKGKIGQLHQAALEGHERNERIIKELLKVPISTESKPTGLEQKNAGPASPGGKMK